MCLLERQAARELHMQRQLRSTADVDEREIVHLAHARYRDRSRVRALPEITASERLDMDDDIRVGKRFRNGGLDRVGRGVALTDGGAGSDRDHDVGELP